MMETLLAFIDIGENTWMLHVFLVVLATVVFNFIVRMLLNAAHRHFDRTENEWDDALVLAAKKPLLLLSWVIGLSIAAEIAEQVTEDTLFEFTGIARKVAIILLIVMFLVKFIRKIEKNYLKKADRKKIDTDKVTITVIARLLRLTVMITGVLVALQTMGISVSGVVAFGGIGGIAVGFAAKDLLANFFGSLMIYLDRPFTVGDWIRSPDKEIEGTVEEIGWRLTVIRTFDKRPLYIPNSVFTTISVENPSRMLNRRIYETFGLRYCDAQKIRDIIKDVKQMLQEHEEIDTGNTMIVNFNTLSASSLDFFIYTFTKTTNWVEFHEIKQDVLLKVMDIIYQHEADIAFPTRTLDGLEILAEHAVKDGKDIQTSSK